MTDTHTHLYMADAYPGEETAVVEAAIAAGVHTLIMPNVDTSSIAPLLDLRGKFPKNVYAAMGLHPTEVTSDFRGQLAEIRSYLNAPGVVALGEIGMDLYHDTSMEKEQTEAFREQLAWARDCRLPVIIHQRGALDRTLDILREEHSSEIPAIVFHCFTEGVESVERIRSVVPDAYFGIGGVCTFKNAPELRRALPVIGLDRIVLETDAPWLAPVPHRGSRNESAYIPLIAARVAEELGLTTAEVEAATDTNARTLFSLR